MITLRYYQKAAVDAVFDYFMTESGNPLIVLPTAAGKSLVQAEIARRLISLYPKERILFCTHQQTLIQQNHDEMSSYLTDEIIGIYSAGLKKKDCYNRIIHAGIQSVYKKAQALGGFALMVVDEAHLIPHLGEGMYRKFIDELLKINPAMKIIGLTATPYRLKGGMLTDGEGAIFTDICYSIGVTELIEKGFLCPLISKNSLTHADLSSVHLRGGEFIAEELQQATNKQDLIEKTVNEIIDKTKDRHRVMVFTCGIDHCEKVKEEFLKYTDSVGTVHSKNANEHNDEIIDKFRSGNLKYLINVDILTTGFNVKSVDCIAILRATMSPGLYYQICGRGLRIHPDKKDCLILDFAQNILRHGPIDKIEIQKNRKSGKLEVTTAPMKECPECGNTMFISQMECAECGYIYEAKLKHGFNASNLSPISQFIEPEWHRVYNVKYSAHKKEYTSLKVEYKTDLINGFSEYVCIEHPGWASAQARKWVSERTQEKIYTVKDFLDLSQKKEPTEILVDINNKYPKIIGYRFEQIEQKQEKIKKEWIRK